VEQINHDVYMPFILGIIRG